MNKPDIAYLSKNYRWSPNRSLRCTDDYYSAAKVDELLERQRDCYSEICDRLASMMEQGAGELQPGERLRQAARMIRNAKIGDSDD